MPLSRLVRRAEAYPRLTATVFGCVVGRGILCLSEFICALLIIHRSKDAFVVIEGAPAVSLVDDDPVSGARLRPNASTRTRFLYNGEVVYDVTHNTDKFGRRPTRQSSKGKTDSCVLFLGGSCTFGVGVPVEQTLPSVFAGGVGDRVALNYGCPGQGPPFCLEQLRDIDSEELPLPVKTCFYTFIDSHVDRAIGAMYVINGSGANMPCYTTDKADNLIRLGTFASARPWLTSFYRLLGKSRTVQYLGFSLPLNIEDSHIHLTARIISELRDVYVERFANNNFFVVIYPGSEPADCLTEWLDRYDVRYLDHSGLFPLPSKSWQLAGVGHPNAQAYKKLGNKLAEFYLGEVQVATKN